MDTLLVAGAALGGLVVGGALDPIGQRFADLSRAEDDRRRAEQARTAAADHIAADDSAAADSAAADDRAADHLALDEPAGSSPEAVRHLLPSGPSRGRTLAAGLVTGVLFAAAAAHFGSDVVLAPFCVFFAMVVAVSFTDLSHRLVPRRLIYAGTAVIVPLLVVAASVDHRWHSLTGAVIAGAVSFGFFFAVWWFVPRGMGYGDVRLAGSIGVTVGYLSLLHAYVAFLAGFVIGMVFGLAVMAASGAGRKARIPFAPSLAVGGVIAVLWGGPVAHTLFHGAS